MAMYSNVVKHAMVPEASTPDPSVGIDAKSVLYFWDTDSRTLKPNDKVEVTVLPSWNNNHKEVFKRIHRLSWGFYAP
ncbi:MAG: hypothetical protein ABWK01_06970 [Infirmifilum sp.]